MLDALATARSLFEPALGSTYLDAATYGLPPRPTLAAMHQALTDWRAGTADWVHAWDQCGEECRARFGELIGAPAQSVALIPSVSIGVATVAASLPSGAEVIVPDDEFTSVLFPILVAQRDRGVRVRLVPLDGLADAVQSSTTLVAFSLVQSQSGRAAALNDVLDAARRVGAQTLVDATHATPFVEVAPAIERIDYLVCAAYKHLLSPRGVTFFYVAPERIASLSPINANWRSASDPYGRYYGGPLDLAPSAARFDVSLAWFAWVGASVSLGLLAEWRAAGVLREPVRLAAQLADRLQLERPVGTVLSVPVDNAEHTRARLVEAGIRASVRAGAVRFSPHVYNTPAEIERTADIMARLVHLPARPAASASAAGA